MSAAIAKLIFLIITLPFIFSGCSSSNSNIKTFAENSSDLQRMLDNKWNEYTTGKTNIKGGIALYIISPKGNFFQTSGMGKGILENIHFRAASNTKTFTAAAILLLQQQNKLNIDHKITDLIPNTSTPYVPTSPNYKIPYKSQITIRQLLEHRAGVFDINNNDIPLTSNASYAGKRYPTYIIDKLGLTDHTFTFDELVGVVALNNLSFFPPDKKFHYSDTGYSILGKIVERVSGQSYNQFITDSFLIPNKLKNTSFPYLGSDQSLPMPASEAYIYDDDTIHTVDKLNVSVNVAEGNLITTPNNLATWGALLLSGNAGLNQDQVDLMTQYKATGDNHKYYGLGCIYTPGLGYGHNGGIEGTLTVLRYNPDDKVTVLIFSSVFNNNDFWGQGKFLYKVGFAARDVLGYTNVHSPQVR